MSGGAIVLLSGGIDSATVLYMALGRSRRVYALTFDYGQKNRAEIGCAEKLAGEAGVEEHKIINIQPDLFGASALSASEGCPASGDLSTYVPGRNTLFLAFALCRAEVLKAGKIFYGANAVDFGGYPDCTPEFLAAFNTLAQTGIRMKGVSIEAPLMHMTKAQIIRKGVELGVDFSMTNSCYFPDSEGAHCGQCQSCAIRQRGFIEAGFGPGGVDERR